MINDEDAYGDLWHFCQRHVYDNAQSLNYELQCILRNPVPDFWDVGHSLIEI